jgi:acetoin utilization protein AcuB
MLVSNWMSKNVITVEVDDSMHNAMKLMKENGIRMLPVLKKGKLVGVVTDRDLKRASASDATTLDVHELLYLISRIKVQDIMTKNPVTVPHNFTVEETAVVLLENKISGVPVVDQNGGLVGIITQTDLFRVLISLTGVGKGGIQFAFQLEDRPGSISSYDKVPDGYRKVFIRMHSIDRSKLKQLQIDLSRMVALIYMVDQRENIREIF